MTREELARLGPAARKQIAQYIGEVKTGKYRNQKTQVDGIPFDSQKEARRFIELKYLLKAGKIRNLKLQPQFTLQESYVTSDGERVRALRYVADFSYERAVERWIQAGPEHGTVPYEKKMEWINVVEDVKSRATRTEKYKIKKKLMLERLGIAVEEI